MNLLLLGGTRYMGLLLAEKLRVIRHFSNIYTLSKHPHPLNTPNHFVCDRKDVGALQSVIKQTRPNVIIDMINFAKDDSEGLVGIYESGILSSVSHYIVITSFVVYNHFEQNKFKEKKVDISQIDKELVDGYTKRKIEMECSLYGSGIFDLTTIVRLPYVFSWDDYTGRFQKLCELSKSSHRKFLNNVHKFSMISKLFAVDGLIDLSMNSPCGFVDLANNGCATTYEMAEIINSAYPKTAADSASELEHPPYLVNKDLCIGTDKVALRENLSDALKREAKLYYQNQCSVSFNEHNV